MKPSAKIQSDAKAMPRPRAENIESWGPPSIQRKCNVVHHAATENRRKTAGQAVPPFRTGVEAKPELQSEPSSVLCFQQKLETKANFHPLGGSNILKAVGVNLA